MGQELARRFVGLARVWESVSLAKSAVVLVLLESAWGGNILNVLSGLAGFALQALQYMSFF
ncbi:hypothetical protein [Leptolyngbya sp. 7M]|uniref:hypothetical protein n=1 Tax=Leptolyngbya sp. 7M TaxID=2812896 RepID=UPI001B8CABCF|nr:hypothetical protein [Leptolyngbya sp. 7M]QYO63329.1 hypothetical protein JVX88_25905 [Leptolyngbya sp. 7M]